MATETATNTSTRPLVQEQVVEYEHYIDQQIDKTRLHVKLVDLGAALLTLLIALLASLIVLVIIDHWIVGLGFWARVVSLAALVAGSVSFLVARVAPLVLRGINPVYAARSIERTFPVLKNSLINALLFRSQRGELREVVYRGVEQQAAVGLSRVDVDSAVDRSPIIHLGYALLALMAVWCAYIFLSPKNPLQTVARVATPWREISRPSKVEVSDVQPGDTTVYRGQTLPISALVDGLDDDEYPAVQFSTADGQIVDRSIRMRPDSGLRFVAELSPTENGIWQDVDYRIVAGDAATRRYRVTALEAPHILVDRVEYDFPAYTKMPSEVIPGEGDIRALEGTRVTVHGVANQPIKSGHIQLLRPPAADAKPGSESKQAPRVAPLQFEDRQAHVAFRLTLKADRVSPVYSGYRLHFINTEGVASNQPVQHAIEVIPDLQPVVEILTPARQSTDVPENAWQRIEIRALDPDFALTKVELRARAKGGTLLQTDLLAEEYVGQSIVTYDFTPSEFGLQAGDEVEYWAIAEDNRMAASTGQPQPNRSATEKQFLRIVAADPLAEPKPDEKEPANGGQQRQPEKGDAAKGDDGSQGESGNSGQQQEKGSQDGQSQQGPGLQQDESGDGEQSDSQNGEGGTSKGQNDRQSQQGDPSSETDPNEGGEPTAENQRDSSGEGGSESQQGSPESGRGTQKADEPLPSDGSQDGEVVERIREYMRQNEERKPTGSDGSRAQDRAAPESDSGQSGRDDQSGESSDQEGRSQEAKDGQAGNETQGQPRSKSGADPAKGQRGERSTPAGDPKQQRAPGEKPSGDGQTPDAKTSEQRDASGEQRDGQQGPDAADDRSPSADSSAEQRSSDKASDAAQADPSGQPDRQPNQTESDSGSSARETGNDGSSKDAAGQDGQAQDGQPKPSSQKNGEGDSKSKGPSAESSKDANQDGSSANDDAGEQKSGEGQGSDASPRGSSSDDASGESGQSDQSPQDSQGGKADNSSARKGTSQGTREPQDGEPGEDDPNLEYSQKATDLVLEYLRDQQNKPDADLLDKLGWNEDDVKSFLRRWEQMKQTAAQEGQRGARARKDLTDVLRSMGLRPPNSLRESSANSDLLRGMRDTGRRSRPPAEYADQYRAFQKSLAGSGDDE